MVEKHLHTLKKQITRLLTSLQIHTRMLCYVNCFHTVRPVEITGRSCPTGA